LLATVVAILAHQRDLRRCDTLAVRHFNSNCLVRLARIGRKTRDAVAEIAVIEASVSSILPVKILVQLL